MGDAVDSDRVNNPAPKDAMVLIRTCDSGRRNNGTRGTFFFGDPNANDTAFDLAVDNSDVQQLRRHFGAVSHDHAPFVMCVTTTHALLYVLYLVNIAIGC